MIKSVDKKELRVGKLNLIIAVLIILTNFFFIPQTWKIIIAKGGTMGFGIIVLPITLSINILLIFAALALKRGFKVNMPLLILNSFGLIWAVFWLLTFITIPK